MVIESEVHTEWKAIMERALIVVSVLYRIRLKKFLNSTLLNDLTLLHILKVMLCVLLRAL